MLVGLAFIFTLKLLGILSNFFGAGMEMETLRLQTIVCVVGHIHFLNTILASSSTIGLLSNVPQHSLLCKY